MGLTLGVGTLALGSLLPGVASTLTTLTRKSITEMNPNASSAEMLNQTGGALFTTLTLILPLALLIMIAGVAGNIVSGGLVFSFKAIRFDMSRINPLAGAKRLLDKQALVRLGLSSAKLAILALISWQVVGSRVPGMVATEGSSAADIAAGCLSAVFQLGLTITILLAVVALTDFVVQRRKAANSIKMTKDEVKQEYRESEGDPQIRGARRRRARQMAFQRMMDAIPTADVVVTNPTTLAVVLKYDSLTMKAPRIVAKGQRLMADRIKLLAREHNVPIVEDKPLARALFPRPIGAEVPAHLYRAVAKLLVLVHQARFNRGAYRGAAPAGNAGAWAPGRARGASPWWNGSAAAAEAVRAADIESGSSVGTALRVFSGGIDGAAAARLYGGGAPDAEIDVNEMTAELDETWLGESLDDIDGVSVDEEALAQAMTDDELGDMTPEELADLQTGDEDHDR